MSTSFRLKKDYYAGALMVIIGVAAAYAANGYQLGTLAHMGSGFFPCAVGVLLALVGLVIAFSARSEDGPPVTSAHGYGSGMPDLRACSCIVAGILAFLLVSEYGGLLPATFAIVFISALGDRGNSVKQAALLAVGMSVIAGVVFWWALHLQMPLFRWGALN